MITNVSLGELPENPVSDPCELILHLSTVDLQNFDEEKQDAPLIDHEIKLATLRAGINEHELISQNFSPLNSNFKFQNSGQYDIYVSGYYAPFEDAEEEEYNEEEEGDGEEGDEAAENETSEAKEEAANKKLLEFVKRHTAK